MGLLYIGKHQDSDLMFSPKRSPIVLTIYEKEALFESLDAPFSGLNVRKV